MTAEPDIKMLVSDMEPVLLNIGQGLKTAQLVLHNMADKEENGNLHFILDALDTRYAELRQQWETVHAAVFHSAPPARSGPRLVDNGGEPCPRKSASCRRR